jgi:AcrR family transcriptional regulator
MVILESDGTGGFTTRAVARRAQTSTPAIYELFGDKAGLVCAVFFEGFRGLRHRLDLLVESDDPRADLAQLMETFRVFASASPALAEVMFARPFADFDPRTAELRAGGDVRDFIAGRVRRCVDAGVMDGDETDIARVLMTVAQGLAEQQIAGWFGESRASVDRRWELAVSAVLDGLTCTISGPARVSTGIR